MEFDTYGGLVDCLVEAALRLVKWFGWGVGGFEWGVGGIVGVTLKVGWYRKAGHFGVSPEKEG